VLSEWQVVCDTLVVIIQWKNVLLVDIDNFGDCKFVLRIIARKD